MVGVHPNEKMISHAYHLFASGDVDLMHVVFADNAVWHEPGRGPLAGDYKGPAEILGFLRQLRDLSGGTFRTKVCDILAETERVVVLQQDTGTRNGRLLDVLVALDFEIHHGKVTEVTVYHQDLYRFDEFWS
jgi:ketosteroid isomerase-like protein